MLTLIFVVAALITIAQGSYQVYYVFSPLLKKEARAWENGVVPLLRDWESTKRELEIMLDGIKVFDARTIDEFCRDMSQKLEAIQEKILVVFTFYRYFPEDIEGGRLARFFMFREYSLKDFDKIILPTTCKVFKASLRSFLAGRDVLKEIEAILDRKKPVLEAATLISLSATHVREIDVLYNLLKKADELVKKLVQNEIVKQDIIDELDILRDGV